MDAGGKVLHCCHTVVTLLMAVFTLDHDAGIDNRLGAHVYETLKEKQKNLCCTLICLLEVLGVAEVLCNNSVTTV
jgi:hypothetical protein